MERVNLILYLIVTFFVLVFTAAHLRGAELSEADRNGTITDFSEYPDGFPRRRCKDVWQNKRAIYEFDFQEFEATGTEDNGSAYAAYQDRMQGEFGSDNVRANCYKTWTVLVAMDAASDLAGYATWDLYEMEASFAGADNRAAGSTIKKDLIVQHSGFADEGTRRYHIFQACQGNDMAADPNCKIWRQQPRDFFVNPAIESVPTSADNLVDRWRAKTPVTWTRSPVVQHFSNDKFESKLERFKDFIQWGIKNYPSKYYLVVVWGHGMGWVNAADPNASFAETASFHLRGQELAEAMRWTHEVVFQGRRKIDNLVTDSCHMQSIEIAAEVAPYTRFFSGSAQVQTFLGLPYRTIGFELDRSFKRLKKKMIAEAQQNFPEDPPLREADIEIDDEPAALANVLPHLLSASLSSKGSQGRVDVESKGFAESASFHTYASFDSELVQVELVPAMNRFAQSVIDYINEPERKSQQKDRANALLRRIQRTFPFQTTFKTRELGSLIHDIRAEIESEFSLPDLELGENCSESMFSALELAAEQLRCAAHLLQETLDVALVRSSFSEEYAGNGFAGVAVWVPRNKRIFSGQVEYFAESTLFTFGRADDAEFGPWGTMMSTLVELGDL